jgi:hypothetical protein
MSTAFIAPYISQIKSLDTMQQGFEFNPYRWTLLKDEHQRLLFSEQKKSIIIRNDVTQSFKENYEGKCSVLKPFILTMIWGFGSAGYGNFRTNIYLSTEENINLIKLAIDAVKVADYKKGFELLKQIKNLGVSYITKVLYFASKAAGHFNYCLIFDIRVATSLIQLTAPKEISQLVRVNPSSKYKDYQAYNSLIHQIALENKLDADAIEFFLYNQKFNKLPEI